MLDSHEPGLEPGHVRRSPAALGESQAEGVHTPLRILQVIEPGTDGAFRVVEQLTTRLIDGGHVVALAYSDRRSCPALYELVDRVVDAGGKTLNMQVGNKPEFGDVSAWWRLGKLAWSFRPDVVHAHCSKAGVLARSLALTGLRARMFYTPHAYFGLSGELGAKVRFYNAVESAFGHIGTSLMTSDEESRFAAEVCRLPKDRIKVVFNCVDAERFCPGDAASARAAFGVPEDAIVLGAIGRLSQQKDPCTLYRAFARVAKREPKLRLLHIGRGELESELSRLAHELCIADKIIRHPCVAHPANAYRAMDAMIMTSRYEGLSMVLLEALATNLPVILSKVSGTADVRPESLSHCWVVPPGDAAAFSTAIQSWLVKRQDPVACNHRELVIERFGMEQWFERHLSHYAGDGRT